MDIFQSPVVILLFVFALVFIIIALAFRSVSKVSLVLAMVTFTAAQTCALILGADLTECAVVCVIFFILSLVVFIKNGG